MNNSAPSRIAAAKAFACGLLLAVSAPAYVGQWHSYTYQGGVTALAEHEGYVYAGTAGGIRRVSSADLSETRYDNLDGLLDPSITGFAVDTTGALWAVARDGYLYTLRGSRWEVWGRSYASLQWRMNPRAVLAAGSHLYLGSEKGLSLFRTRTKVADLNITRFRDELGLSVLSLLRRGDSLYVGTSGGVFKARVYFADPMNPPEGYANLADPSVWTRASFAPDSTRRFNHLAFVGDSLATFGPGTLIQQPLRVEAFEDTTVVIGPHRYTSAWRGYSAALVSGGRVFVGGRNGLALSADPAGAVPNIEARGAARAYPRDSLYAVGARNGRVWAQASTGLYALDAATGNFNFQSSLVPVPSPELYYRSLRNVVVSRTGDAYIGTWGNGLVRQGNAPRFWKHQTDNCIYAFDPADPYSIVASVAEPYGNDLYFSVYKPTPGGDHQLVHLDLGSGAISCPSGGYSTAGQLPHGVRLFNDTLLGSASNLGVTLYKVRRGIQGPTLQSLGLWTLPGTANEAWDMAQDRWGRQWALIGPNLAYFDSVENSASNKLKPIDNFVGQDCKNMDVDPDGMLWLGCSNGLFQVATEPGGELGNVRRYGLDDGLLSLRIFDVGVDSGTGRVWVATDRGVSMLESAAQPPPPNNALQMRAPYPNPFRPQHRFMIFDNLPRNATLRLHDADGRVVRIFHPRDLTGAQVQWDGRNDQGKPVGPGVYLYSVVSGSAVTRGKIIVAR